MIMVGFDGREGGRDALVLGQALLGDEGGPLAATMVLPFTSSALRHADGEQRPATWKELHERLLEQGKQTIRERSGQLLPGIEVVEHVVVDDSAARGLSRAVAEAPVDALVLGSTHRGRLGRILSGSIPTKLLSGGESAVALAPRGYADRGTQRLERICAGYDGRAEADAAVEAAAQVARRCEGSLELLAIAAPAQSLEYELRGEAVREAIGILAGEGLPERREERLQEQASEAISEHAGGLDAEISVLPGDPAETLIERSEQSCDLLVLGSRGYGPLGRTVLGSTSTKVLNDAASPVLVVPRPDA